MQGHHFDILTFSAISSIICKLGSHLSVSHTCILCKYAISVRSQTRSQTRSALKSDFRSNQFELTICMDFSVFYFQTHYNGTHFKNLILVDIERQAEKTMVGLTHLEITKLMSHKSNLDLRNSFPYRMQDNCSAKCLLRRGTGCLKKLLSMLLLLLQPVSIPIREENFSTLDACSPLFEMQASQISATNYFLQVL